MSESVALFTDITGADPVTARHYLDSAGGDVQRAIDIFFNNPMPVQRPPPRTNPAPPRPAPLVRPAPQPRPVPSQRPTDTKSMIDDIMHHAEKQQGGPPETFDLGDDKLEKVKVTFWKNGFQVDDGDFRSNDDPQNQEFLQAVSRGVIPRELYKPGVQMDVEIEDMREKDYKAKPKPRDPYAGGSRTLGGPSPSPARPAPSAAPAAAARTNYAVEGTPSTKIRMQMPGGQVLTFTVSTTATVGDLKRYVRENRPDLRQFTLQLTFPPRAITEDSETIEQAGLKMSQIQVRPC